MSGIFLLFIVAIAFLNNCKGNNISDKRLCFDPKCSVPISLAKGLIKYSRNHETLSFSAGEEITIFSKSAGSRPDLWGAEVGGKRGYVPKSVVKELKIFHEDKTLTYTVPTSSSNEADSMTVETSKSMLDEEKNEKISNSPSDVQSDRALYEVVEGTTIFSDPLMIATPTVSSIHTTSKKMTPLPAESTVSFIATTGDMNMQSSIHSEMSPISATTMIEKPEMTETSIDTSEIISNPESGNMVESMINLVSDLVSGMNEGVSESGSASNSEIKDNKKDLTIDETANKGLGLDKSEIVSDESSLEGESKGDDRKKPNTVQEGEMEEKSEEEDDEDDDGEDEGEYEEEEDGEEEEGEDNGDEEENGDAENEEITHESDKIGLANENQNGNLHGGESEGSFGTNPIKEEISKHLEVTNSTNSVSSEQTQLNSLREIGKSESRSDSADTKRTNVGEDVEERSVNLQSENQGSPTLSEMDVSASGIAPTGGEKNVIFQSKSTENQVGKMSNIVSSEFKSADNPSSHPESLASTLNTLTSKIEFPENKEYTSDFSDKNNIVAVHYQEVENNERKLGQNELPEESIGMGIKSLNNVLEFHMTTPESILLTSSPSLESEEKKQHTYGDHDSDLHSFGNNPTILSEVSYSEHSTSDPISDHAFHKSDSKETDPSHVVAVEKDTSQEKFQSENLDLKTDKHIQIDANQQSNAYNEKDSVELPEKSNQQKENVGENPNVSDSNDQFLVPQESTGILSVIVKQLSSYYGFVTEMVFGNNGEDDEIIDHKGTDDKYGESEIIQKQPIGGNEEGTPVEGHTFFGSSSHSHCEADPTDSHCKNLSASLPSVSETSGDVKDQNSEEEQESVNWIQFLHFSTGDKYSMLDIHNSSYGALIYSVITGFLVLCFFLGHYFIEGKRRDVLLLAKINSLEKELTVTFKECLILREKLKISEIKSSSYDDSSEVMDSIKSELEKVQNEKAQLERELEATTEAGLEMELMVSQFLSSQPDSKRLMESIEQLQMQANQQQAKISTLENNLISKTQENENLAQELSLTEQKVQDLEEDLKKVTEKFNERDEEQCLRYDELKKLSDNHRKQFEEDLKNKIIETEMALTRCKSLELSLTESKDILAVKENEISVLQECLQQLKISNGEDPDKAAVQLKDMLDFGKLKAELIAVAKERDSLKEELQGEEDARKLLEDHVKVIREEVEKLRKCHETAEREKVEAQTRLEVLSSYFKDKETQLQKELGIQEAMRVQKNTDSSTIMQHMKSLEEEVENYRKEQNLSKPCVIENTGDKSALEIVGASPEKQGSQNETLKKEILDQERGYKTQLATFEKKAHENWVAARQAERKLEESKQEASQLRNRLTMNDKNNSNSVSQNGDESKPNTRRKKFSKIRRFWSTLECAPSDTHNQTK